MIVARPRAKVKPTRNTTRPASRFGVGLSADRPRRRMPYTASDLAWAAHELNKDATDYEVVGPSDAAWDRLADEALASARVEVGLVL